MIGCRWNFRPARRTGDHARVMTTCKLRVDRRGFKDQITFDVENLPHGVWVDNIGLSGILIPAAQNELTIYISSAPWVPRHRSAVLRRRESGRRSGIAAGVAACSAAGDENGDEFGEWIASELILAERHHRGEPGG